MLVDDIRDHAFDAAKGWRTGAVRYGFGWNRGADAGGREDLLPLTPRMAGLAVVHSALLAAGLALSR